MSATALYGGASPRLVDSPSVRMATAPKPSPVQADRFYLPELDSLRFFAFLTVFLGHGLVISGLWARETGWLHDAIGYMGTVGFFGVDLFFVLSAYLLTELMLREKESRGSLDIPGFYLRRLLRIWPLYFSALAVAFVFGGDRAVLIPFALFVGNFATMAVAVAPRLGTLWSISVEEQFYLFWPLVVRDYSRESLRAVALRLWAVAIAGRVALLIMGTPPAALWENTLSHVDALACGILLSSTSFRCPRRAGLIALGTALWLAGGLLVPARVGVVVAYPLIGLGAAAFVLAALGVQGTVMRRPPLVYLGRISYGLYVIHLPVLMAVRQALGSGAWPLCLALALAITIGAAAISYRWLESPFLRLKKRFERLPSRPV